MNKTFAESRRAFIAENAALLLILFASLAMVGCGSHSAAGGPAAVFPEGSVTSDEIDKFIRFDARVDNHETDGNKLIVNVNQSWMSSPPGLRERSLAKWFGMWQAAHGGSATKQQKGFDVVARFDGKDVAEWTADGYKWLAKESKDEMTKSE